MDNSTALQDFLYLPNQFRIAATTIFLAGAEFDDTIAKETILPNKVKIKLRFPAERRVSRINGQETVEQQQTSGDVNQLNWMTGLLFPEFQTPGPRNKEEKDGGAPGLLLTWFEISFNLFGCRILQRRILGSTKSNQRCYSTGTKNQTTQHRTATLSISIIH